MPPDYDVVILGSGSTAFAAALRAAAYGARTLMIEKSLPGGTCVNWGCIPSKTMIHAALFAHEARIGEKIGLGLNSCGIDYQTLMNHRDKVVEHLRKTKYLDPLHNVPGLTLIRGTGRFIDPHTIEIGDQQVKSDRFLVATGGGPRTIEFPGIRDTGFLTSRSALLLKKLPQSLIIIGGGVIALELGQMFHRLGTRITILEHGPRLIPAAEAEPALRLQHALAVEGLEIDLNVEICSLRKGKGSVYVNALVSGLETEFVGGQILMAVGTTAASAGIGLESVGVEMDQKGFIRVDERMRTSVPGIWAAGDVVGRMMIASVGAKEGAVAVEDMFKPECGCRMDYQAAPMTIFTDPELGMVGYGEEGARNAGFQVVTSVLEAAAIPKAHVTGATAGVIKMVADRETGRILGVHLVCHRGAELINEAALAIRLKATIDDLANTLHVFPSMGEGLRLCAQGFSRDVTRLSCCAE